MTCFRVGVCHSLSLSSSSCGFSGQATILLNTVADTVAVADVAVGAVAFAVSIILLFREFGAPYLFLNALLHPSIRWRSQEFRLHWGGKAEVEVVDDKKKKKMFSNQEVQAIKLVSNSGKLGEFMSSRSIS